MHDKGLVQMNGLKKVFKHPVYWIRYGISFFVLWPGFWVYDLGKLILVFGNKLMNLAVVIEGEIPEDDDYQASTTSPVRTSGQAVSESVVVPELSGSSLREDAERVEGPVKLVLWTESRAPAITQYANDTIWFFDYPELWDFKVGDVIHYRTAVATLYYEIEEVKPANLSDYSPNIRRVTARRVL